jgi:hypothetical protein
MSRDSVIFYKSFHDAITRLPEEEQLAAYKAVFDYAFNGKESTDGLASAILLMAKPQIDANNKRYEDGKKGAEYGKLGGRPKKEKPEGVNDENPIGVSDKNPIGVSEKTPNVNVNVNENVNANENVNENGNANEKIKRGRFAPPSLDEIKDYCLERNNKVDPEGFYDFYQSKGWKVGNSPMKDWKAAIRTWEKRDNRASPQKEKFDLDAYLLNIINGEETG